MQVHAKEAASTQARTVVVAGRFNGRARSGAAKTVAPQGTEACRFSTDEELVCETSFSCRRSISGLTSTMAMRPFCDRPSDVSLLVEVDRLS
jgi:hypothetical protein